jgi:hypothetical protein
MLKILYTLMVGIVVPVYWYDHGPVNFLWFSDIALLVMLPALWLECSFLVSMMAVGVLPMEFAWLIDFLTGGNLLGIADYMFGAGEMPIYLRVLSGFHIVLPFVMLFSLFRLGYDGRAFPAQTLLTLVILPVTYFFSDPAQNINWVYGPGNQQTIMPPLVYLGMLMMALPIVVYMPMHFILRKTVSARASSLQR